MSKALVFCVREVVVVGHRFVYVYARTKLYIDVAEFNTISYSFHFYFRIISF